MPELPEVQTIVDGLNQKIKGRKIIDLWTDWPKYFRLPRDEKTFRKHIIGKKIIGIERRGKNILIYLSNGLQVKSANVRIKQAKFKKNSRGNIQNGFEILLIHQKISGHLLVGKWRKNNNNIVYDNDRLKEAWQGQKWIPDPPKGPIMDPMNRFIRLIFFLDNGQMLALSDLRRFAKVLCGPKEVILNLPDLKNLGPEPLDPRFSFEKFRELFKRKKGKIKQILMNQSFISGIGNIYADEILWFAKIHPLARVEKLKEKDLKETYQAMKFILKKAIRLRGTSIDDYRDAEGKRGGYDQVRYVYQRENEPCLRCGVEIKRLKISGRSAHYCPKCQKL